MKRMVLVAYMLFLLCLTAAAFAEAKTQVDFENMSLEEIQALAEEAEAYYKDKTTVPLDKGKEARMLLTEALETVFPGQEISGPLFGFNVKRERDIYTIDDDFTSKVEKEKTKHTVHAVMLDTGKLEITELVIDGLNEQVPALEQDSQNEETQNFNEYGEQVSMIENEGVCVLKYRIESSLTNRLTIQQNYHTVENFIKYGGGDQYDEIQYWAVATMSDGSEGKVISFTVSKELIENIKAGNVVAIEFEDYVDDLWILPSLL